MKSNQPFLGAYGRFYREAPDGRIYRCCEAQVEDPQTPGETRLCRRAAAQGDRLCATHAAKRRLINRDAPTWGIFISKRNGHTWRDAGGNLRWRRYMIGKIFHSQEDARLWCDLNSTLIFAIPDCKSYCIERIKR